MRQAHREKWKVVARFLEGGCAATLLSKWGRQLLSESAQRHLEALHGPPASHVDWESLVYCSFGHAIRWLRIFEFCTYSKGQSRRFWQPPAFIFKHVSEPALLMEMALHGVREDLTWLQAFQL